MQFVDLCPFSKLLKGNGVTLAILVKLIRTFMPYMYHFLLAICKKQQITLLAMLKIPSTIRDPCTVLYFLRPN
jgi:hypothetical protein